MTVNITLNEISVKNGLEVLNLLGSKEILSAAPQLTTEPKDSPVANAMTNLVNSQAPISFASNAPTVPATAVATVPTAPISQTSPYQQTVPTQPAPSTPITAPVSAPTSVPSYTIEQFQAAIAPLLDAGKVQQIQQLVQSFGVATLMDIPKERYGEFANGLRSLGGVL